MRYWPRLDQLAFGVATISAATLVAALLESFLGVSDASPVYLLAVVVMAGRFGTVPAVGVSVVSVLVYDFLFTQPRFNLAVQDPQEWLSLLLFLVVAVVIGRLSARQSERAAEASARARDAQTMFAISRALAVGVPIGQAATEIVQRLREDAGLQRVWVGLGPEAFSERRLADTDPGASVPQRTVFWLLHRMPGSRPAEWVRTHGGRAAEGPRLGAEQACYRVTIAVEGAALGSVWAVGPVDATAVDQGSTRALSLAADQLGLAVRRDQLAATATSAELARRSDALKSALLDSVSHDLRTPLARIRALAGGLLDEEVAVSQEAARTSVAQIDQEAARLNEIVANLLDLSRIEGGALRPELEAHDLADLVQSCLIRHGGFDASRVSVDVPESIGPVLVDALFLDQALTNVLENAFRHGGLEVRVHMRAVADEEGGGVGLVVEDDGPGVADVDLSQLFDKFYRGRGPAKGGAGIGLTVARGLVSAMGGEMTAGRSSLGGLAVRIHLRLADAPNSATAPPSVTSTAA